MAMRVGNMIEKVILVDSDDNQIGEAEKMQAHLNDSLHRAFSIFIFDAKNRLLIQQRAQRKYHSGGLWTNTCCGHPRPGEETLAAAHRRLQEEFGFDCPLKCITKFIYHAKLDNNLSEHEIDNVLIGFYNDKVNPDPNEIMNYSWEKISQLQSELQLAPEKFTAWFKLCFDKVIEHVEKN